MNPGTSPPNARTNGRQLCASRTTVALRVSPRPAVDGRSGAALQLKVRRLAVGPLLQTGVKPETYRS
jgi:hypothetical protein